MSAQSEPELVSVIAQPSQPLVAGETRASPAGEIDWAIERARGYILARQMPSGAWSGQSMAGVDPTAEALIALHYAGALAPEDARRARRWLIRHQLADGSFEAYEGQGHGTLDETAIVYAALIVAGEDPRSEPADQAWRYIKEHGGFDACSLYTRVLLATAKLIPANQLAGLPLFWTLIPGVDRLMGRVLTPAFTLMNHLLPALIRGLKQGGRVPDPFTQPIAALQRRRILDYMASHQNPTGNFFGAIVPTVIAIICFKALGIPASDTRLMRAIDDLAQWRVIDDSPAGEGGELYYTSFDSQVWNTALIVSDLCEGGVPAESTAMARGIEYLITRQSFWSAPPDWQNPTWGTPRTGGWPFEDRNPLVADCDSTGQVLRALGQLCAQSGRTRRALEAGQAWLFGMQNADGGWPAFSRGQRSKPPGPFPLTASDPPASTLDLLELAISPPIQYGDPSTADLTGRVLQGLGQLGYRKDHPRVARAIEFLREQRWENGVWWGRWETNYLAGSAEVLTGLAAVHEDMSRPDYLEVIDWIEDHQNHDGGWGETVDSYDNLALAGIGETNTYLTGLVTKALIACGRAHSPSVQRALRYLLDTQREDGSWAGGPFQFVVQWPWPFYRLVLTPTIYPLTALTAYRNVAGHTAAIAASCEAA